MIPKKFYVPGLMIWMLLCLLSEGVTAEPAAGTPLAATDNPAASAANEHAVPQGVARADAAKQEVAPGAEAVTLEADTLVHDQATGTFQASGNVTLSQGNLHLQSDQLILQSLTRDVVAEGAVQIRQADDALSGQRIHYSVSDGRGSVQQGRVFLSEKNFHLSGEDVERTGEETYAVVNGRFTTCDGEVPDWEFSAEKIDISLGRYARARNAWFRVKDIPVFYLPYMVYPVKTERESGLLIPRVGQSSKQGVKTLLAWYQVIDRNQDATIYLDYFSKMGVGKGLEYRYFFGSDNQGRAEYYHITGISDTPDMFALEWQHGGTLPGNIYLTADARYVDNKQFFEDFGEVAEDYNRDKTLATVIGQRNWQKLNLAGHLRYLKDLEQDNDMTLQQLPELSAALPGYRVGRTPLYAGFESYATRFQSDRAVDGERLDLRPSVTAVFRPGSWLELSPEIALSQRFYNSDASDDEVTVPEYAVTLSTRLGKVFPFERWGMHKIKHSIEPSISYLYVPDVDQGNLPFFDLDDRLVEQDRVAYALVNRFTARMQTAQAPPAYREIVNLRLSQNYDINEAQQDDLDDKEPFSDLRVELAVRATDRFHLELDSRIDVYDFFSFNWLEVGAGFADGHGNRLQANYNYRNEAVEDSDLETDYLGASMDTALLKPVYLHFEERYDFRQGRELEKFASLEYRARCWSIILSYRDRLEAEVFMVKFVLAGLGNPEGYW
jgi:LPS-assembly protein